MSDVFGAPIRILSTSQDLHAQKKPSSKARADRTTTRQTATAARPHRFIKRQATQPTPTTKPRPTKDRATFPFFKRPFYPIHWHSQQQHQPQQHNPMTILPLSSTPGRNTPNQQTSSYFPSQDAGPTIGIPGQDGGAFGRRKTDGGHGFGFGGSNSSSGRVHRGGINGGGVSNFVPLFLRRIFRFPHMDFQVQSRGLELHRRKEDRKRRHATERTMRT